jgi:STE24 endopeptidase
LRFRRRLRPLVWFGAVLAWSFPQALTAQNAATQSTPAPVAVAAPSQANPQQAYTLPPDKLAKAIAISRIRNILDIAGSIWGIVFLWLLLATRALAGSSDGRSDFAGRRWVQGLVFSPRT